MPIWMTALFAAACGFTVANLYYAQPLIGVIASSLNMHASAASFVVTLAQLGYCAGLIFLVPLGDLVENRRLVVCSQLALVSALVTAALSPTSGLFLLAMSVLGVSAVAAQMLLPIAAHMTRESSRGHVIGTIMSGLLMGFCSPARYRSSSRTHLAGVPYSWDQPRSWLG
ncbi:MFS transporter [Ectopseudomonas guguanensis]|uniref:MFS transporter n=1 Tax=Ectopseudomonas guguanensis TaxID=1198456 RepID=UPI0023528331|nr:MULTISPECIES: MFS transporter [Pseudomonas]